MITTLIGSRRFVKLWDIWNQALTYEGHLVFSICTFPNIEGKLVKDSFIAADARERFDAAHLAKIAVSDAVVVLNANGYVGDTTRIELVAAISNHKQIYAIDYRHLLKEHKANFLQILDAYNLITLAHGKVCKKLQNEILPF